MFGQGKSAPLIALAHEIPYVATATIADLRDLEAKVEHAMGLHGPRYIHILAPCPLGWGSASADSVKVARLAAETGIFPVFEGQHGDVTSVSKIRRQVPVEEYLSLQRRYAHLFAPIRDDDVIARIQARADRNIERFGLLAVMDKPFAITLDVGSSQPTRPARGAPSAPSTSTGRPPAAIRAPPERTFRPGSITPRKATTRPPGE